MLIFFWVLFFFFTAMRTLMQACGIFDTDVSMHLWEEYCIFGKTGGEERGHY